MSKHLTKQLDFQLWWQTSQTDFLTFCERVKVSHKDPPDDAVDTFFSLHPDKWWLPQKLYYLNRKSHNIVLKARQQGISTLINAMDLHYALTKGGVTVVVLAHTKETAKNALNQIKEMHSFLAEEENSLGFDSTLLPKVIADSAYELRFDNKSRILVAHAVQDQNKAKYTCRGIKIDRLHLTEMAFYAFPKETMGAVKPAAEKAKEIDIESTPLGKNLFHDRYFASKNGGKNGKYRTHFLPWFTNPLFRSKIDYPEHFSNEPQNQFEDDLINTHKIDDEQLHWFRLQVEEAGLHDTLSNYPIDDKSCFALGDDPRWITRADIDWYKQNNVRSIVREEINTYESSFIFLNFYKEVDFNTSYIMGCDIAGGLGGKRDYSAIYVIEQVSGEMVASLACNTVPPVPFAEILVWVASFFNEPLIGVENNGTVGGACIAALQGQYPANRIYHHKSKENHSKYAKGFVADHNNVQIVNNLIAVGMSKRELDICDVELIDEIADMVVIKNKAQAPKGGHDDRVRAYGICLFIRNEAPVISGKWVSRGSPTMANNILKGTGNFKSKWTH